MRLKILVLGNDPIFLMPDCQLLRNRGLLVFTAFNLQNINELTNEIKPDIVFFDVDNQNKQAVDAYNEFINNHQFNVPVIYTLSDDEIYLVTRKRTELKEKRTYIADSIISAVKMSLSSTKTYQKKTYRPDHVNAQLPIHPASI